MQFHYNNSTMHDMKLMHPYSELKSYNKLYHKTKEKKTKQIERQKERREKRTRMQKFV
jgi:hypothetical protein